MRSLPTALLVIVALGVALRLMLFFALYSAGDRNVFFLDDTRGYMQIADNVLAGNGYSMSTSSPYIPDGMRTPVLPYVFVGVISVFKSPLPYVFIQIALSGMLAILTFLCARLITGKVSVALLSAALMMFEPFSFFITLSLLTETLFATLITFSLYLIIRYMDEGGIVRIAVASAIFGIAALTRPIAQFIPVVLLSIGVLTETWRTYLRYAVVAVVPFVLVLTPWVVRNHGIFGAATISSGGYQNVYSDLGASIISYRDGSEWYVVKKKLEQDFADRQGIDVRTIQQNLSLSPVLFKEGLRIMAENPVATMQSFTAACIAFLTNDSWSYYLQYWHFAAPFSLQFSPTQMLLSEGPLATARAVIDASGWFVIVPLLGRLFWLSTAILFFVGLFVLFRGTAKERAFALVFVLIVLYYLGLSWSAGAGVNGRYRYPIHPIVFIGASMGAWYVLQRARGFLQRS